MDDDYWKLVKEISPVISSVQAQNAMRTREKMINLLLRHKKIPENGWDDATIELLLNRLALMDSNNFTMNSGVGEREGRIASVLVARRHYNFSHGIGRSGDLTELQPKACGSSLMYRLTHFMLQDLFKLMGFKSPVKCLLVPVATGMSLVLSMLTFRTMRPGAKFVIWSRIDQKSCFKSILTAGYTPIIIDGVLDNEMIVTNLKAIEEKIAELGKDNVLCVMSTTSCFAPRICDDVESISKLCKVHNIPHLINNAYGLQSKYIVGRIDKAQRVGRVDVVVQSTDKNLMVPVGGAIITTFDDDLLNRISKTYPGRASSTPVIDVFITLLSLGKSGYTKLVEERDDLFQNLVDRLQKCCPFYGEKVLSTVPGNPISIAVTLSTFPQEDLTKIGSVMFLRNVSGMRVVSLTEPKTIEQHHFKAWGCHSDEVVIPYLTCAAAIGVSKTDIDKFVGKLEKLFAKYKLGIKNDAGEESKDD